MDDSDIRRILAVLTSLSLDGRALRKLLIEKGLVSEEELMKAITEEYKTAEGEIELYKPDPLPNRDKSQKTH